MAYRRYNKYGNKKVIVDGIKFDSEAESLRYKELKIMEHQGLIAQLVLQPEFELLPKFKNCAGKTVQAIRYKADFKYWDVLNKKYVVEDVKGMKTDVYKLKKKMFEYRYGIPIIEIGEK